MNYCFMHFKVHCDILIHHVTDIDIKDICKQCVSYSQKIIISDICTLLYYEHKQPLLMHFVVFFTPEQS